MRGLLSSEATLRTAANPEVLRKMQVQQQAPRCSRPSPSSPPCGWVLGPSPRHATMQAGRWPTGRAVASQAAKDEPVDVSSILSKYQSSPVPAPAGKAVPASGPPLTPADLDTSAQSLLKCNFGLGLLLAVNLGVYGLAVWAGKASTVAAMVLSASGAKWWQYASATLVHVTWSHLVRDLASVWLSGRMLRKELTTAGVWITYLLCGVGANLSASLLMPPHIKAAGGLLGVGATGAAAGLALTALALGARPSLGYLISAVLYWQLLIGPMLALPVPGGPSVAQVSPALGQNLLNLVFAGPSGLPALLAAVKGSVAKVAVDPGLTWLWGAVGAAVLVVLVAKFPEGEP